MAEPSQFPLHWPGALPVPGFPGYVATPDGHVASLLCRPSHILREDPDKDGYPYVLVRGPRRRQRLAVHKAVALAFHGVPQAGQVVRHRDGTRTNPRPGNLVWGTPLENSADREAHGRTARGLRHGAYTKPHMRRRGLTNGRTKVTPATALAIYEGRGRQCDIGERFGVSQQLVSLIKRGEAHVELIAEARAAAKRELTT